MEHWNHVDRDAHREAVRQHFIEGYEQSTSMDEAERAWWIGNVDWTVENFLDFADRVKVFPTEGGAFLATEYAAVFVTCSDQDG